MNLLDIGLAQPKQSRLPKIVHKSHQVTKSSADIAPKKDNNQNPIESQTLRIMASNDKMNLKKFWENGSSIHNSSQMSQREKSLISLPRPPLKPQKGLKSELKQLEAMQVIELEEWRPKNNSKKERENKMNEVFKDGTGNVERFMIPQLNIELIEMISKGARGKQFYKNQSGNPVKKVELGRSQSKLGNIESEKSKGEEATLEKSHDSVQEDEMLNLIAEDNQFGIDETANLSKLKRSATLGTVQISDNGDEDENKMERMKDEERNRQEANLQLMNIAVLNRMKREGKLNGKIPVNDDEIRMFKMEKVKAFKTLQDMRIDPLLLRDHSNLELLRKKTRIGQKGALLTNQDSLLLDVEQPIDKELADKIQISKTIERKNKLISSIQTLKRQNRECSKYLQQNKRKLEELKSHYRKLYDQYKQMKSQLVEKIKKMNKKIKAVAKIHFEESNKEHQEREAKKETPNKPISFGKIWGEASLAKEDSEEGSGSLASPLGRSKNRAELANEGAVTLLMGDYQRKKHEYEEELKMVMEHEKETLISKKDYLQSLEKYVRTLEETQNKNQLGTKNMYLYLLRHPADIV